MQADPTGDHTMADDQNGQIVKRTDLAKQFRDLAKEVVKLDGEFQSADPDLRDTLLGMVDSLYCKSFPDEDGEPEEELFADNPDDDEEEE